MRQRTRRRQLEQSPRGWPVAPHGPFGPVKFNASTAEQLAHPDISVYSAASAASVNGLGRSGRTSGRPMSMTAFFEYLHDHEATTDLAKALAEAAMLRTTGATRARVPSDRERIAS